MLQEMLLGQKKNTYPLKISNWQAIRNVIPIPLLSSLLPISPRQNRPILKNRLDKLKSPEHGQKSIEKYLRYISPLIRKG